MDKKILILLVAMVMLVSACKNSTQDNNAAQQPAGGQQEQSQQQSPSDTGSQATQPPAQTGNSDNDAVKSFFSKITGTVQYKITYDMTSTAAGKTTTGTQTIAMKDKNMKVDFTANGMSGSSYFLDGTMYSCTNYQGQETCFELASAKADTSSVKTQNDVRANWTGYNLVPKGTRTIAGTQATCFDYSKDTTTGEYCFSADGAPLYIKVDSKDSSVEMTATEYSNSVSDSEFTLPATPQKMPSY